MSETLENNQQNAPLNSAELDEVAAQGTLDATDAAMENYEENEATATIIEAVKSATDWVAKLFKNMIEMWSWKAIAGGPLPEESKAQVKECLKRAGINVKEFARKLNEANQPLVKKEVINSEFVDFFKNQAPKLGTLWTNPELKEKMMKTIKESFVNATQFWVEHAKYLVVNAKKMLNPKEAAQQIVKISEMWEESVKQASEDIIKIAMGPAGAPVFKLVEETWEVEKFGKQVVENGFDKPDEFMWEAVMWEAIKDAVKKLNNPIKRVEENFKDKANEVFSYMPWARENEAINNMAEKAEETAKAIFRWTKEKYNQLKG